MQSFWLKTSARKHLELLPIDLPVFPMASEADMWTGPDDRPESVPSRGIQCLHLSKTGWPDRQGQQFVFVLTGQLHISSTDTGLTPGDTLLVEQDIQLDGTLSFSDDCRVLILHVSDWTPRISADSIRTAPSPATARQPNFKWMYTGADGQAYFSDFDELFDEARGWGATMKPAYDTMLIEQADGFFMDWHTEGANNIVIILTGRLELETAGGGKQLQHFYPGDICFAVDRTGKGHIDRARGATLLATIVIPSKAFVAPS